MSDRQQHIAEAITAAEDAIRRLEAVDATTYSDLEIVAHARELEAARSHHRALGLGLAKLNEEFRTLALRK
jgi:hypothetical protein